MSRLGKVITQNGVWGLEKVGFVPKGTFDVGESLKVAAEALVAGGKAKLFTPMALWICRKVSVIVEGTFCRSQNADSTAYQLDYVSGFWILLSCCYACTVYVLAIRAVCCIALWCALWAIWIVPRSKMPNFRHVVQIGLIYRSP